MFDSPVLKWIKMGKELKNLITILPKKNWLGSLDTENVTKVPILNSTNTLKTWPRGGKQLSFRSVRG